MSLDTDKRAESSRKALKVAVAALSSEAGFGSAKESALETLVEMLQSYLGEIGRSARAYTELAGRTESMVSDVVLALVDMGLDISGIPTHAKRQNKTIFIPPASSSHVPVPRLLQVGEKRPHPSHIPDSLPPFPDPHTYIKTDAVRQPFNEYQLIREKAATQKREIERTLTRFIARTGETQNLFRDDVSAFPLIAVRPSPRQYLAAMLPRDRELDAQEMDVCRTASGMNITPAAINTTAEGAAENQLNTANYLQSQDSTETDTIDNPYLRTAHLPKSNK